MPKKIPTASKILEKEISQEMKESYIDYAMSVIIARALPDVRDGLKPVHRRILYAMKEDGLTSSAKFRKSATVVGSVLGRYHPHGDAAVYDALVRMAQDFVMRYPLIEGQGNFGSIDGDSPAQMRYTECRLTKIAEEMLKDIEKDTVDFQENYDRTRKEPVVLPSLPPNLLLNGSLGIAVGMATNIPPHNLGEVCDAAVYLLDHPEATTQELFEFIQGPDFPTGGIIFNKKEIISAYSQGRGPILVRGKAEIVEKKSGRWQIVITEIPYQVQKSDLISQIAKLVQEKKIEGIKTIRDESDKEGMRIVIELRKNAFPQKILNSLYKYTDLQKKFYLNMLALVDGIQPKVLSLVEVLSYYLDHRKNVVLRRSKYELKRAKEREHILEGLVKCLGNIDKVISTIKKSKSREEAKKNLIKKFRLSEVQAEAILETKLATLARLERQKIEEELKQIKAKIKELEEIIKSPKKVKEVVKKEILELKAKYQDPRKTQVVAKAPGKISEEDLIPEEETVITLTQKGYIKRVDPSIYRTQQRGGKGIIGVETEQDDLVEHLVLANTHDLLLIFTDTGKVFGLPVYEIPKETRTSKGRAITNFLEIQSTDKILAVLPLSKGDFASKSKFLVMATKNGLVKKTPIEEFKNLRSKGLIAIRLKKGDILRKVQKTSGNDLIVLITKKGMGIVFSEKEIRPMARNSAGIRGIRLKPEDELIGMEVIKDLKERRYLLVVSENGYGKMSQISQLRLQKRGGKGITCAKISQKTGFLQNAHLVFGDEDLVIISKKGQVIRISAKNIPILGRATQGVRLMKLEKEDKIASLIYL